METENRNGKQTRGHCIEGFFITNLLHWKLNDKNMERNHNMLKRKIE